MFQLDVNNYDLVMESDIGTFTPTGIDFTGMLKFNEKMLGNLNVCVLFLMLFFFQ
jgi:hypothetical protein